MQSSSPSGRSNALLSMSSSMEISQDKDNSLAEGSYFFSLALHKIHTRFYCSKKAKAT